MRQVSANLSSLLGLSPQEVLGRSFETVVGAQTFEAFQSQIRAEDFLSPSLLQLSVKSSGSEMQCVAHRHDGMLIVELEPAPEPVPLDPLGFDTHIRRPLARIRAASDVQELARVTAIEVRKISGFERVMIYRFDPEWNGEVMAEAVGPSLVSYLGLRYPASDIPSQARQLFLLNCIRTIVDVDATQVPIVPEAGPGPGPGAGAGAGAGAGRPLDLTYSVLRSASPIHLEYLRNMAVKSSLTISLVVEGHLWGMIACHHHEPRPVSHLIRSICENIGQAVAAQAAMLVDIAGLKLLLKSRILIDRAMVGMETSESLAGAIRSQGARLLDLFGADGIVSLIDGVQSSRGVILETDRLATVIERLRKSAAGGVASSDEIGKLDPGLAAWANEVSGVLYIGLFHPGKAAQSENYLVFSRREFVESIAWAGNPNKALLADEHDRLHPRTSFEEWRQIKRGVSRPWTEIEIKSAILLRDRILRLRDARELASLTDSLAARLSELRRAEVDLKIASQKAKDATDAAEAARRTMNEFDAMSRDVRKPASSIIAMTKLLLDTDLTDQQRRYAENMRANGESLLMLIDNLLESDSD